MLNTGLIQMFLPPQRLLPLSSAQAKVRGHRSSSRADHCLIRADRVSIIGLGSSSSLIQTACRCCCCCDVVVVSVVQSLVGWCQVL